jgi:hypothetical protein
LKAQNEAINTARIGRHAHNVSGKPSAHEPAPPAFDGRAVGGLQAKLGLALAVAGFVAADEFAVD